MSKTFDLAWPDAPFFMLWFDLIEQEVSPSPACINQADEYRVSRRLISSLLCSGQKQIRDSRTLEKLCMAIVTPRAGDSPDILFKLSSIGVDVARHQRHKSAEIVFQAIAAVTHAVLGHSARAILLLEQILTRALAEKKTELVIRARLSLGCLYAELDDVASARKHVSAIATSLMNGDQQVLSPACSIALAVVHARMRDIDSARQIIQVSSLLDQPLDRRLLLTACRHGVAAGIAICRAEYSEALQQVEQAITCLGEAKVIRVRCELDFILLELELQMAHWEKATVLADQLTNRLSAIGMPLRALRATQYGALARRIASQVNPKDNCVRQCLSILRKGLTQQRSEQRWLLLHAHTDRTQESALRKTELEHSLALLSSQLKGTSSRTRSMRTQAIDRSSQSSAP